jgi:hypothetical protein
MGAYASITYFDKLQITQNRRVIGNKEHCTAKIYNGINRYRAGNRRLYSARYLFERGGRMRARKLSVIVLAIWLILIGLGSSLRLAGIDLKNLLALAAGILLLIDR